MLASLNLYSIIHSLHIFVIKWLAIMIFACNSASKKKCFIYYTAFNAVIIIVGFIDYMFAYTIHKPDSCKKISPTQLEHQEQLDWSNISFLYSTGRKHAGNYRLYLFLTTWFLNIALLFGVICLFRAVDKGHTIAIFIKELKAGVLSYFL